MNLKYILTVFFILSIIFNSCETDFDATADWKDICIVYGLLNQNDSIHYIKINKAFLGDGNALVMAQNEDSSSYGNNLEVKLQEWRNGSLYAEFYLDTITIYNKEAGDFYYPKQVLYKTNAKLYSTSLYKLIIANKITGKTVSSETKLIKNFSIEKPYSLQQINFAVTTPMEVKWNSAVNGKLYQVTVRFYYTETNNNTNITTQKYVDWVLGSKTSSGTEGGETMTLEYYGEGFFENLRSNIPVNESVTRQEGKVEYIFSVAGEDFNTYMEVNKPASTIVQEKPEYTNINNGIGIFSCRYDNTKDNPRLLSLTARSSDSLKNGRFTYNLGF